MSWTSSVCFCSVHFLCRCRCVGRWAARSLDVVVTHPMIGWSFHTHTLSFSLLSLYFIVFTPLGCHMCCVCSFSLCFLVCGWVVGQLDPWMGTSPIWWSSGLSILGFFFSLSLLFTWVLLHVMDVVHACLFSSLSFFVSVCGEIDCPILGWGIPHLMIEWSFFPLSLPHSFILSHFPLLLSVYTSRTFWMCVCSLLSPFSCRCVVRLAARSLDAVLTHPRIGLSFHTHTVLFSL